MNAATCRFWVGDDMRGHVCEKPVPEARERFQLCDKHYEIELRRTKKRIEKDRASRDRSEAAWLGRNAHRLPAWRSQLERAEAEYDRRTAAPVNDRAAVGGFTHPSVARRQLRHLSDSNVKRVGELDGIIRDLKTKIARAEKSAA